MTNREKIQETFPNMIFIGTVMMYKPTDQVLASGINYNWLNAEYEIPTSSTTKNNLEVDAISRQAVIDELKRYFHDEYYQRTSIQDCRDCFIKDVLNHLPSVTPQEPRWIPVSESLPEESYGCLVTVYDTDLRTQDEFENILPYFVGYDGETWNNADIEQANAAETKKEVAKQNYESGLNDAWECVRKIGKVNWLTLKQIGFEIKDKEKNPSWDVVMEYSASEAITKIKDYEEKQKQTDDKIKVGDEVDVPQLDCKGIVIAEANKETILVLSEYMDGLIRTEKHNVKKTGRYFSEIGEMKKKIQVDDKDN